MKICSHCREAKAPVAFNKDRYRPDGLAYRCRACVSLGYQKNAEKRRAYNKAYRAQNPEKRKKSDNREYSAWRAARSLNRVPSWADRNALRAIYNECEQLQAETGVKHRVAHIVPLHGALESGLHIAGNLHIVTPSMRRRQRERPSGADKKDRSTLAASWERRAWREALKLNRVPPWADRVAIRALYNECERLQAETGVKHRVAHIVPLDGTLESGLHVARNLHIITPSIRRRERERLSDADKKDRDNKAARHRRKENPQIYRKACNEYYRRNIGASRERAAWREALKLNRVPPWADRAAIRALYDECERIKVHTGVKHSVAHIIPLQRKFESGLHIAGNLRIIPVPDRKANAL